MKTIIKDKTSIIPNRVIEKLDGKNESDDNRSFERGMFLFDEQEESKELIIERQ